MSLNLKSLGPILSDEIALVLWIQLQQKQRQIVGKKLSGNEAILLEILTKRFAAAAAVADVTIGETQEPATANWRKLREFRCRGCNELLATNVAWHECPVCGRVNERRFRFVAVRDGGSEPTWGLYAEYPDLAPVELPWPKDWPETVNGEFLRGAGFQTVSA